MGVITGTARCLEGDGDHGEVQSPVLHDLLLGAVLACCPGDHVGIPRLAVARCGWVRDRDIEKLRLVRIDRLEDNVRGAGVVRLVAEGDFHADGARMGELVQSLELSGQGAR